jgi:hypothetical protein
MANFKKSVIKSVFEYQNPNGISSESTSLNDNVFLTSQIYYKCTWNLFHNTLCDISQSHKDIC